LNKLINTVNNNNSENTYYNPKGISVSCGSNLLILQQDYSQLIKLNYIYKIDIDKSTVLYIKNLNKLIEFHNKYSMPEKKNNIDWKKVQKDYDGLIICPYLGYKIWGENSTDVYMYRSIEKYILRTLDKDIKKYPPFFLEWYRFWGAQTEIHSSGIIWRKSGIKKIELIK